MSVRITGVVVATAACVVAGSALAASAAPIVTKPFTATYAGAAIVRATSDSTADISAKGKGKGNVVGVSTIVGIGAGSVGDPCSSWRGKGTITSKLGKLNFTINPGAQACPGADDPNQNAITGTAKLTGGTLAFKKAKGTLRITGNYDRGTGKYTATFKGKITY